MNISRVKILSFISGLLVAINCYSGPFVIGNGGGGVTAGENQPVFLLDFAEAGLSDSSQINCEHNLFQSQVEFTLAAKDFPVKLISCKISEIYLKDKALALAMLTYLQIFNWQLVNEDLAVTPDTGTALDLTTKKYVQIANRRFNQILINLPLWSRMSDENKVGLIIHEITYGLFEKNGNDDIQTNTKARTVVAYFFSSLAKSTQDFFFNQIKHLPSIKKSGNVFNQSQDYYLNANLPAKIFNSDLQILFAPILTIAVDNVFYQFNVYAKNNFEIDYNNLRQKICDNSNIPARASLPVTIKSSYFTFDQNPDANKPWSIFNKNDRQNILLETEKLCDDENIEQLQLMLSTH